MIPSIVQKMKSKDIQEKLREHQIIHAWLTWSQARGTANEKSDIDLLVQIDTQLPRKAWGVFWAKALLDEKFGKNFDIIIDTAIDKHIQQSILQEKILLW